MVRVTWVPGWYELDPHLEVGLEDEFAFWRVVPEHLRGSEELFLYNDSMITGLTHAYYKHDQYEHHKISGRYRKSDSLLVFTEDSVIGYWFIGMDICEGRYTMKLTKTRDKWILSGRWKDKEGGLFACPATTVWLEKPIPDSLQEKDVTPDTARAAATARLPTAASPFARILAMCLIPLPLAQSRCVNFTGAAPSSAIA